MIKVNMMSRRPSNRTLMRIDRTVRIFGFITASAVFSALSFAIVFVNLR